MMETGSRPEGVGEFNRAIGWCFRGDRAESLFPWEDDQAQQPTHQELLQPSAMDSRAFDFQDWRQRFEIGDERAATDLVDEFYERLVRLARKRLAAMPPQIADHEGAVISALRSFFSGIQDGQFSQINNQHDLWRVLATVTARKAIRQLRAHWKPSGEAGRVRRDPSLIQMLTTDSSPEDEAILVDQYRSCMEALPDDALRKISQLRLEGLDTDEIAQQMSIHVRSVQRKLKLIEDIWLQTISNPE